MSVWKVYSKDGSVERCELNSLEYSGTAMGERAVTATFDSSSEVDFEVFDYIEYRGEKFELEAVPTVKKVSSFEYIYELRFVSLKYELERCEMRDLVPYDNEVVYPTPLTFSFTGNVRYLTERIQACLDALYGSGIWNIIIADGVESEEKNITIAQQNCWNALALVSSTYGLSFYIKGRTITIGGEQPLVGHTFEYGKGNGLYEIERASDTNTGIVTKLRAYGSTRNLDYSYPKRPEWSDSALPVSFAFSPLRLMLPSFKTDGKTDYVLADSATIAKYGIREASMVYDDIYPTITGATYNGQAIDEIKSVEAVDDNAQTFVVHLHDLGFDLEERLTNVDAQISMKTGAMQGYTFTMSVIEKQGDGSYKITLGRISAEGGDNYNIPNSDWNMKAGDKFVLLNILMPQMYIREAENRLKERAEEYLAQYGKTNFSYNIGLHDKFLIENPSVYDSLIEGPKLRVRDAEIGIDEEVTIQSITITENAEDNILPQVKVTLNNESSASTLERIQGRIDALANETAAGNFATQSEIMAQYRKKLDKPFFDKLFVAVDAEGNEIASNDITTPVAYIKAKYDFAVVGGVSMYTTDKDLDIPSIYDGLPIDMDTLYWVLDENGKKLYLKANGGEGNGSFGDIETLGEGNAITKVDVVKGSEGEADKLVFTKEKVFIDKELLEKDYLTKAHIEENYYTKNTTDEIFFKKDDAKGLFVTLDETTQEILGVKTFKNGLNIGSSKIWQSQNDVIYVDANLVVRGGVTMYGLNKVDVPTIMAGVAVDDVTISKKNGYLEVIGGGGGSIEYPLSWSGYGGGGSWDGTEAKTIYIPSKISELTNDSNYAKTTDLSKYLPLTGGTLTGELIATTISGGGENLYLGNENNSAYVYLNEDMRSVDNGWSISLAGVASFSSLTTSGNFYAKGTRAYMPTGNDGRGFAFAGQDMQVHWDYSSTETIFHLDGNNCPIFSKTPQVTGSGYLADRTWVNNNYLSLSRGGTVKGNVTMASGTTLYVETIRSASGNWMMGGNNNIAFGGNYAGYSTTLTGATLKLYGGATEKINITSSSIVAYSSSADIITIKRTTTGGGALVSYKGMNQSNLGWGAGVSSGHEFVWMYYTDGSLANGAIHMTLDKNANLTVKGGVTMYGTSDRRLKKNIRTFRASEEFMKLGGVYQFEYIEEEIKRNDKYKGTHFGLIYQNVKESSLSKMCMEREDGFGALNYLDTSFISLLAAVGMEHETRLQRLERENMELRMEVEQLKNK